MSWQTNVLVVANRTAGSGELLQALADRAAHSPCSFHLLVPATVATGGDAPSGRELATRQLADALERMAGAGLEAGGEVGDPDPIVAVHEAWDPGRFDEIVVSTLPTGTSRWLALDLPRRVGKACGVPVTHVVARERAAAAPAPSPPPKKAGWTSVLTGRR